MALAEIQLDVEKKLDAVRRALKADLSLPGKACLTCSFQAEDVLLAKLAITIAPELPVLFLDTGYHFQEIYEYRDRLAKEWRLNLINLYPATTREEQEQEFGLLYQSEPNRCCQLRKVEPLFKAVSEYDVWITGLRREQAKSRAALEERSPFKVAENKLVTKLAPLASWSTRDVWYASELLSIPRLALYDKGYSSIGCAPCTALPLDPSDPRSGRWAGQQGKKVECGIHIEAGSDEAHT